MNKENSLDLREMQQLDSFVADIMRRNKVYGLSIHISKEGQSIYARGYGLRSVNPPRPATPDTLYGIGSATKIFTALAVLKLVEKLKIRLEDPVDEYIHGLKTGQKKNKVTIHQLLSHTSGYPDLGMALGTLGQPLGEQEMWSPLGNIHDLLTLINGAEKERISSKGDVFMYWNEGYVLLSNVIEVAGGESYPDFVRKNILEPLEMNRSTFDPSKLESDIDSMVGYYTREDGNQVPQKFPYHPLGYADGGLISSVSEMSHLLIMLMNEGNYNGRRIISKELVNIALTPHIEVNFPTRSNKKLFYGYGIVIDNNFLGHSKFGHGGNVAVSSAYFGFIPDQKIGVAIASNSDFGTYSIADYALCLSLGKSPEELEYVEFLKRTDMICGRYETYNGSTKMQISMKGPNLFMEIGSSGRANLIPIIAERRGFFAILGPNRVKLEVKAIPHGIVDIRFDRLVFHRVGKI
ncbi:MAG: serine hydrolase [Thermoplasmatales archaeon]